MAIFSKPTLAQNGVPSRAVEGADARLTDEDVELEGPERCASLSGGGGHSSL
ncbi:MAG: hypothetical protein ACJ72H_29400 [Candidatus Sulfotelmatobacter sp.]